ncbi:hypothetical protein CBR_g8195 [Chara braunii]|uniref:Uncharacterized protein n=1 Tax=Chara braunii TaxID=69332 RepID=A0A388KLH2_CHABU|nr:hypothetical protein CBR_g8195 [Chara braunii]|eukprot:GBG70895.1 hypothetical protein CBR_g8195 [Chara braunii]
MMDKITKEGMAVLAVVQRDKVPKIRGSSSRRVDEAAVEAAGMDNEAIGHCSRRSRVTIVQKMCHIIRFCQLLSKDEKEGKVFTTIRGEVFDYEGNLIDPNIEGGMRNEAFHRMGRSLPATFRTASPKEAWLAKIEEAMTWLAIPISGNEEDNEDESLRAEEDERARRRALERDPEKRKVEVSEEEPRKKKNIYSIPVEHGIDIERLIDNILESQRDLVTLKEILVVSPKIREEFKQRMTRKRVIRVKLDEVIPHEANWSPPGTKMD